jgi:hypothetical protein
MAYTQNPNIKDVDIITNILPRGNLSTKSWKRFVSERRPNAAFVLVMLCTWQEIDLRCWF